jgi:hypothetical protein
LLMSMALLMLQPTQRYRKFDFVLKLIPVLHFRKWKTPDKSFKTFPALSNSAAIRQGVNVEHFLNVSGEEVDKLSVCP